MGKDKILELINSYWKFDDDQQPVSNWHDKQDLLNEIEQLPISSVSEKFTPKQKRNCICVTTEKKFWCTRYCDGK